MSADAVIDLTMRAHEGFSQRTTDKVILTEIHRLRKEYDPSDDPFLDGHRLMRIYEDEAQRRGLTVPGGAYKTRNPKKKIVQKPISGRKLQRTVSLRSQKLAELEQKAFARLRGEENPHPKHLPGIEVTSADELKRRGIVGFVNVWKDPDTGMWQHRFLGDLPFLEEDEFELVEDEEANDDFVPRTGNPMSRSATATMKDVRRSNVAREVKSKRTARALRALANPSKEEYHTEGDLQWNTFTESYDRWSVSDDPKDLLDAFEASTRAEIHYRNAGVEHGADGRGSGPAGAEAEGIRREFLELER
jgi:hypothetical protein